MSWTTELNFKTPQEILKFEHDNLKHFVPEVEENVIPELNRENLLECFQQNMSTNNMCIHFHVENLTLRRAIKKFNLQTENKLREKRVLYNRNRKVKI